MERRDLILIAGATGYIGGRLLWMLESEGYNLRCLARRPEYLRPRIGPSTQVVAGDVFAPESLDLALTGVDQAYYLVGALQLTMSESRVFEIGGKDQVSYRDIMSEYARQRSLRRIMISVPVITPRLSSLWLALITPIYARIGRKLVDSIRNPTIVRDQSALTAFNIRPLGLSAAIAAALRNEDSELP